MSGRLPDRTRRARAVAIGCAALGGLLAVACRRASAPPQTIEIPFTMADPQMFVSVTVNDSDRPLTFVFDTGATGTVLDSRLAAELGVQATAETKARGASGDQGYKMAAGQRLTIAGRVALDDLTFVLIDLADISAGYGAPIHGIVGNDLLRRYLTEIDFSRQLLRLHAPDAALSTEGFERIDFEFGNGIAIPQFEAAIVLADGERLAGPVFFDSGAAATLIVNTPFATAHRVAERDGHVVARSSKTLTAEMTMATAAAQELHVGAAVWRDVPFDIAAAERGVSALPGYLGILGNAVIARFDWIVDYAQRRLWCRPNARHAAPFEWPVAGASFEWRDGAIAVTAIVDGSPAAVAGLRQGDHIVAFGDRDLAASPPHDNVVEALRDYVKQLDAKVHVAVLRGDARHDLEWTTRRLR